MITIVSGMSLTFKALKGLSTNNDLIIQKLDKGNSVVLLNRNDYIKQLMKRYPIPVNLRNLT